MDLWRSPWGNRFSIFQTETGRQVVSDDAGHSHDDRIQHVVLLTGDSEAQAQ